MPVSGFRLFWGWIREFIVVLLFLLHVPFGFLPLSGLRRGRKKTVVLVPDVLANPLFYFRLRGLLISLGFSVYSAPAPNPFRGLREEARALTRRLEEFSITDAILLGHGMGGLVGVALPDSGRRRFVHLITLGTPFHGSRLYQGLLALPQFRDMSPGSDFLLINRLNALLFPQFTPFVPYIDELIVPSTLGHFGQGRDLVFDTVGHYNLVMHGENLRTLAEFLLDHYPDAKPAPSPGSAESVPTAGGESPKPPAEKLAAKKKTGARAPRQSPPPRKKAAAKPPRKTGKKPAQKKSGGKRKR